MKGLFESIIEDESIRAKLAEKALKKEQFKIELAAKEEERKKSLLAAI